MSINYIPNDPLAQDVVPMRQKDPRPNRPIGRAGFVYMGNVPEGIHPAGTPEFLFWQCREAALATVETWETINGDLSSWAESLRDLDLLHDNGVDLNAYYDRASLAFFQHTTGAKTTYSGASTDVVAHEVGHALLDVIKPDLWFSNFIETGAFHEAFGDCMALVTALADPEQRRALLAISPDLRSSNFLEATAEDLSDGVRRAPPPLGKNHSAAKPRRALNSFQWQLPTTLPTDGKPDVLTSEIHSFGHVFSGCFYDTIANIFASLPTQTDDSLWEATRTAFMLLVEGARNAPEVPRFFRSVGSSMVLADTNLHNGANHLHLRNAFASHSVALGSAALLAPVAALAGRAPNFAAAGASGILATSTRRDLLGRIQAPTQQRLAVNVVNIAGQPVVQAINRREVKLDEIDSRLQGVVAIASEPILVGAVSNRAAMLGGIPDSTTTVDETLRFVEMLLRNNAIELASASGGSTAKSALPSTHAVRSRAGKRVLTRLRFACGCQHCA